MSESALETGKALKVLVVDDSPMMCRILTDILLQDDAVESVDRALNGKEAIGKVAGGNYDVCTLDVHMPGMNGLSVLKNIMIRKPLPTLMVSAFTGDGSRVTFEALRYGAVDFFKKPSRTGGEDLMQQAEVLRQRIRRAARVRVGAARYLRLKPKVRRFEPGPEELDHLVVVYAGTGGYSSLLSLIPAVGQRPVAPVVVSMFTPGQYLNAFVDYLSTYSSLPLVRADKDQRLKAGVVYFLAGDEAASFDRVGNSWEMVVESRPIDVEREGPVDLLLLSASENFGDKTLAMFLSGDSPFGVTGAGEVLQAGGRVLVQDPAECLSPVTPRTIMEELDVESRGIQGLVSALEGLNRADA